MTKHCHANQTNQGGCGFGLKRKRILVDDFFRYAYLKENTMGPAFLWGGMIQSQYGGEDRRIG